VRSLLLAVLLALAGPLTGSLAAAVGPGDAAGGDRTAQAGRDVHDDAVTVGSTRLFSSSRIRTAAPRTQLDSAAADLPRVAEPVDTLHEHFVPGTRATTAPSRPRRGAHSRAPPA
jgi:hypothetical protein